MNQVLKTDTPQASVGLLSAGIKAGFTEMCSPAFYIPLNDHYLIRHSASLSFISRLMKQNRI